MRLPARSAFLTVALLAASVAGARAETGDVVIQAGHQGRPASCAPLHVRACNLGTSGADGALERDWTPIVADAAAGILRAQGYAVIRRPADYAEHDSARAAVFLHFDGAEPCASGASVGFPPSARSEFVSEWERRYRAWFPYRFVGENISENESRYYGFRKVDAPAKMLIEFGEMTCPAQFAWMEPRLHEMGERLAAFLIHELPR